jgi:hypothetical protein
MNLLFTLLSDALLSDNTPSPIAEFTGNADSVTPGVIGFVITFGIAVATVLLVIDMTRRVRRVRYRAEVQEQLEAERLAAELAKGQAKGKGAKASPEPEG